MCLLVGKIFNSVKGVHVFAGSKPRTPGQYFAIDPDTNRPTSRLLENTNESMHASVRVRYGLEKLGLDDHGAYYPEALNGWKLMGADNTSDGSTTDMLEGPIWWQYISPDPRFDPAHRTLYEEKLGEIELELLRHDSTALGDLPPQLYAERLLSLQAGPFR